MSAFEYTTGDLSSLAAQAGEHALFWLFLQHWGARMLLVLLTACPSRWHNCVGPLQPAPAYLVPDNIQASAVSTNVGNAAAALPPSGHEGGRLSGA